MRRGRVVMRSVAAACVLTLAIGVTAGSTGARSPRSGQTSGGTLVFGTSNDPRILDPALASDGESLRVSSQIYETLVTTAPGSTEVIPKLATSWSASDDGLDWTFELQQGVVFHDGEPFDAAAVCFNFDRWYNFKGPLQLNSGAYY